MIGGSALLLTHTTLLFLGDLNRLKDWKIMNKSYNWVPIFGEFDVKDDTVVFHGKLVNAPPAGHASTSTDAPAPPNQLPALGEIVSDQYLATGTVSAEVTFEKVGSRTACAIVLGYDVDRGAFIKAGFTREDFAAFSIQEWQPGTPDSREPAKQPQWVPLSFSGDRSFIKSGQAYRLRTSVFGSHVALEINGVSVASANLRTPILMPRPVGLWCSSHSKVTVSNYLVAAEQPRAFVVMHFAKPFDEVYADVIKETCHSFGLETVRADEIYGPGLIIQDIVQQILRSQIVIAEITPENANVYFEVGYALAWNKPIVLLARHGTQLPFDVSGFRVLLYEDSIGGKAKLQKGLQLHLQAILGRT